MLEFRGAPDLQAEATNLNPAPAKIGTAQLHLCVLEYTHCVLWWGLIRLMVLLTLVSYLCILGCIIRASQVLRETGTSESQVPRVRPEDVCSFLRQRAVFQRGYTLRKVRGAAGCRPIRDSRLRISNIAVLKNKKRRRSSTHLRKL